MSRLSPTILPLGALFGALTITFASPAYAVSTNSSAPISVERSAVLKPAGPNKSGLAGAWWNFRFHNTGNVAADRVTVRLNDQTIVDAGAFAPGITIDHFFLTNLRINRAASDDGMNYTIVSVHFVDGTTWNAT